MAKTKIIHFVLSPEDNDLIAWKMSLPKRRFNRTVCEILVYESLGKIADVPHEFSSTDVSEPMHCRLIFRDENAIRLLEQIPAGEVTSYIKKIIRKHIRKNITKPNTVSAELLLRFLYVVKARIESSKVVTQPERYMLVRENYGHDLPLMLSAILDSYIVRGEKRTDNILQGLTRDIKDGNFLALWWKKTASKAAICNKMIS